MTDLAWLLVTAFGVGTLIGAVGIGGVLLIPALVAFAGLPIQIAMATALFTFLFTGIAGSILFQRRGSIDWSVTRPLLIGALFFSFIGAWANSRIEPKALSLLLAGVVILAGVYTLVQRRGISAPAFSGRPRARRCLLVALGSVSGFGSGLTGVGGPVLSVPLMMLCGFSPLASIASSQVIQVVAAGAGTLGNLEFGNIDFGIATQVTVIELAGVVLGTRIVHAINTEVLRSVVAVLCIAVGATLAVREIG